jgi:hypothetical protein
MALLCFGIKIKLFHLSEEEEEECSFKYCRGLSFPRQND